VPFGPAAPTTGPQVAEVRLKRPIFHLGTLPVIWYGTAAIEHDGERVSPAIERIVKSAGRRSVFEAVARRFLCALQSAIKEGGPR